MKLTYSKAKGWVNEAGGVVASGFLSTVLIQWFRNEEQREKLVAAGFDKLTFKALGWSEGFNSFIGGGLDAVTDMSTFLLTKANQWRAKCRKGDVEKGEEEALVDEEHVEIEVPDTVAGNMSNFLAWLIDRGLQVVAPGCAFKAINDSVGLVLDKGGDPSQNEFLFPAATNLLALRKTLLAAKETKPTEKLWKFANAILAIVGAATLTYGLTVDPKKHADAINSNFKVSGLAYGALALSELGLLAKHLLDHCCTIDKDFKELVGHDGEVTDLDASKPSNP